MAQLPKAGKKAKEWRPTPAMEKYLEIATDPDYDFRTDVEAAELIGVSPKTIQKWRANEKFRKWFSNEYQLRMEALKPHMDKIGIAKMGKSEKHWVVMQEKYGGYKQRVDVTSNDNELTAGLITYKPKE